MHRFAVAFAIVLHLVGAATLPAQAAAHRVSIGLGGADADALSLEPSLSENGRFIAFQSYASNLVADDTNGCSDVFVRDRETGRTTRVSVSSAGVEGNYYSGEPAISPDGRFVAFRSDATNLVAGDKNGQGDVFVHDLQTRKTIRVSLSSAGFEGNRQSTRPAISRDGRFIAFASEASNLVADDKNGVQDVFVRDRARETTTRIVAASVEPDGPSGAPSISADGKFVAFETLAPAFGHAEGGASDVVVCDLRTRKILLASADPSGRPQGGEAPSISRDGSVVVFESAAGLLPADVNDARDVYAWRTATRELELASVSSEGASGYGWTSPSAAAAGVPPRVRAHSTGASVSGDGRFIAFVSLARGLAAGAPDGPEVYVRDLKLRTTRWVCTAGAGGGSETGPCLVDPVLGRVDCPVLRAILSEDGKLVGFQGRGARSRTETVRGAEDVYVAPVAASPSVGLETDPKPEQGISVR
jgi:Tol biopolymer transport system component